MGSKRRNGDPSRGPLQLATGIGSGQYAKGEYDFNLQWTPFSGALKGLMMRLRYAHVVQDDPAGSGLDDLRLMVFYTAAD